MVTIAATAMSSTEILRAAKVARLEQQFIDRGVAKWTAKAWAEAEVEPEYMAVTASSSQCYRTQREEGTWQ